jgi:serine/threonine-protein kinase RsbW
MSSTPPPGDRTLSATLPSTLSAYQELVQSALDALTELGWSESDLFAVHMALEESISNAVRHGNREDPAKKVDVEMRLSADRFWARICDEGPGFCPEDVPDCCDPERREIPGGRGLTLMQGFMTLVQYNDCGNCITLEKRLAIDNA